MVGELKKSTTIFLSGSVYAGSIYAALAFLYLFYPLAGCLADIRWGRYKTTINSLCFIFWGLLSLLVAVTLAAVPTLINTFSSTADNNHHGASNLATKESNAIHVIFL